MPTQCSSDRRSHSERPRRGRLVKLPALVTVVAVLLVAALLGVIGALFAIPAAAVLVLGREVAHPRLDHA